MTDIKEKALALLNKVRAERRYLPLTAIYRDTDTDVEALCRAIEQHEATKRELSDFRQEASDAVEAITEACNDHANTVIQLRAELSDFRQKVSDAVGHVLMNLGARHWAENHLNIFIIPKPKPDPLVEALTKAGWGMPEINAKEIRAALDARGLEIKEKGQ